jgi:adenosyl cobinamide kinase/adenosyl cobinamide phosphate guanylyltransferase
VTQSGKTLELQRRLRDKPRWIVLDYDWDRDRYDELPHVRIARGVEELTDEIRRRARERPETWRVSYRASKPGEYLAAVDAMWALHRALDLETTLLVVEEAHRLLEEHQLPTAAKRIIFQGLKRRLVLVTVSQNVQQVPAQVRHNTDRQVFFRQIGRLPQDVRQNLGDQVDLVRSLEPLTPAHEARRGVHYVFHPEHLDDREQWRQL